MIFRFIAALVFALALSVSSRAETPQLNVVATTAMIADAVKEVGGDKVRVTALMGEGVDPHSYRLNRTDIAALLEADMVFWNGLYLEAQMEEFLLQLATRKPVVALAEAVPVEARIKHADYDGRFDPHVWMSPKLWGHVVKATEKALSAQDPQNAEVYRANAARYIAQLEDLAAYGVRVLSTVPETSRVLVTAHDAFGYFGAAFGFEVHGVQGISTESEAGLQHVESLVDLIVTRKVEAVFFESSVSERNVKALVEGAEARGATVRIGAELYSDAMGAPGTYTGTYLGMIDHNLTEIANALGGNAPKEGWQGKLRAVN